jgi:transcriptional regulator with XRE-family HTH domain
MASKKTTKRKEIGKRIRAYRMGAGLSPEEAAKRLQVSRAALYKYERTGVVKLETIERFASIVGVSVSSLLGASVEYFNTPVSFFERKRQLELQSVQIFSYVEPISFLITSKDYTAHLRRMIVEGLPRNFIDKRAMLQQVDDIISILDSRHDNANQRQMNVTSVISAVQTERFLRTGMIGTYNLPSRMHEERRMFARLEIERLAALVENEPIGIQIGIVDEILPHQTFELLRQHQDTWVAVSPFRLGEFPNISLGVASITSAAEAVTLYERLARDMWARAYRGADGAKLLRNLIRKVEPDARPTLRDVSRKSKGRTS